MDYKVIPSANITTQHWILVMNLVIMRKWENSVVYVQSTIMWGALTKDNAQELGKKLLYKGLGGVARM